MSTATEETIWVGVSASAKRLNLTSNTVHGWVSAGKLKARKVTGHGAGGKVLQVCEADLLLLAAARRERLTSKAAGVSKVKSRTCRAGLEPDPLDSLNPCDAVKATLDHDGVVLTAADHDELARRREKFERRKAVPCAA